ncbi:MAG TPA: flavodoxin family protein [Methanocorpusculum sp.]|nr:flavodoxin family protein [Methanocorpusculum sp.]
MKVTGISSSYHAGSNSGILVENILAGAKAAGAETQMLALKDLSIKPCTGCSVCKMEGKTTCIQKDDFEKLIDSLRSADIIVFGSPIYFGRPNAPFLNLIDRFYSQMNPDFTTRLPKNKKFAVVLTSGSGAEETTTPIIGEMKRVFGQYFGWEYAGLFARNQLYAPREVEGRATDIEAAKAFGKKLTE